MNDKSVNGFLIAIMFEEPLSANFSYFSITAKFKERFDEFFANSEPIPVSPGAQGVPPEVPRYILKTEADSNVEFSFSGIRFDFRFSDLKEFNIEFLSSKLKTIQSVLNEININPFRIGIVLNGDIESDDSNYLLNKYILKDSITDSKEIQLHFRSVLSENSFSLNEWRRYGTLTESNKTEYAIDLNTMDSINSDLITGFIEVISKRLGDFIE